MRAPASLALLAVLIFSVTTCCCFAQEPPPTFARAAFSPDGKTIAFSHGVEQSCFIYLASLLNGKAHRLTAAKSGCETDPAFSPDGKFLVYSSANAWKAKSNLYTVPVSGGTPLLIYSGELDAMHALWAGDDLILFAGAQMFGDFDGITRPAPHHFDVYSIPASGGAATALTASKFYDMAGIALAKDGRKLAFPTMSDDGERFQIYDLRDMKVPKMLLSPDIPKSPDKTFVTEPAFAPDGNSLYFTAAQHGTDGKYSYSVFRFSLISTEVNQIEDATGVNDNVCISPDGKTIFYLNWQGRSTTNELRRLDMKTKKSTTFDIKFPPS